MEEHRIPAYHPEAQRPNFYPQHPVDSRLVSGDFSAAAARNEPPPIPFEIVRGLLLGHIDPVMAATSILSREEAAIVAYRHQPNALSNRLPTAAPTKISHGKKHSLEDPASEDKPMDRDQISSIESLELARISSSSSYEQSEQIGRAHV